VRDSDQSAGVLGDFASKTAHANSTSRMKIKPLILKGSIWPWGQSDRILEISDRKVRIAVCSATIKACH